MNAKKLIVLAGYILGLVICGARQTVFDRAGVATLVSSDGADSGSNW